MKNILVSIIVPVYNVENYLGKCLNSLRRQTLKEIEIIVINDGSTDNSSNIIKEFLKIDKRFRLICQENRGLSEARNSGINMALGKYLMFVDGDDYIEHESCENLYRIAESGNIDLLVFGLNYIYSDKVVHRVLSVEDMYFEDNLSYFRYVNNNNSFTAFVCNKFFRKSIIDNYQITFQKGFVYEDLLFTIKYLAQAESIVLCNKCFYNYLQLREGSISNIIKEKDLDVLKTIELVEKVVSENISKEFVELHEFKILIYDWVANSILYKYPLREFFNDKGDIILKSIIKDRRFSKYIKYFALSQKSTLKRRIPSILFLINIFSAKLFVLSVIKLKTKFQN